MSEFIRKTCLNKLHVSIQNCHPGNKFKIEGFWFVFKSFLIIIFTDYQKTWSPTVVVVGGGGTERAAPYGKAHPIRNPGNRTLSSRVFPQTPPSRSCSSHGRYKCDRISPSEPRLRKHQPCLVGTMRLRNI